MGEKLFFKKVFPHRNKGFLEVVRGNALFQKRFPLQKKGFLEERGCGGGKAFFQKSFPPPQSKSFFKKSFPSREKRL